MPAAARATLTITMYDDDTLVTATGTSVWADAICRDECMEAIRRMCARRAAKCDALLDRLERRQA